MQVGEVGHECALPVCTCSPPLALLPPATAASRGRARTSTLLVVLPQHATLVVLPARTGRAAQQAQDQGAGHAGLGARAQPRGLEGCGRRCAGRTHRCVEDGVAGSRGLLGGPS